MLRVRAIGESELDAFAALDPETPGMAPTIRALWEDGSGRPAWTLIAEQGDQAVARAAFYTDELGCGLPVREGRLAALWASGTDRRATDAVRALLDTATAVARGQSPFIERRLNPEVHGDIEFWQSTLMDAGYRLFQEKQGFVWTDGGQSLEEPARITLRSVRETGIETYAAAMASCIPGTLDRNDRYYLDACGPDGWGREMVGALELGGEDAWLLGYEPDGTLAGYVAVGTFEEGVGTIVHIGVAPDRRGRGYVNELLRAANRAARAGGFRSLLSDVDTENLPMLAAMERNGHRARVRPWHVWAYRLELPVR